MKVLLVDDDDLGRKTIHQMLERAGHTVTSTGGGAEALELFQEDRPDLVMTDLIMPDTDGLELIQALRKLDRQVKILAISGGGRVDATEYLAVARKFGAVGILTKPFSHQAMTDAIDTLA